MSLRKLHSALAEVMTWNSHQKSTANWNAHQKKTWGEDATRVTPDDGMIMVDSELHVHGAESKPAPEKSGLHPLLKTALIGGGLLATGATGAAIPLALGALNAIEDVEVQTPAEPADQRYSITLGPPVE